MLIYNIDRIFTMLSTLKLGKLFIKPIYVKSIRFNKHNFTNHIVRRRFCSETNNKDLHISNLQDELAKYKDAYVFSQLTIVHLQNRLDEYENIGTINVVKEMERAYKINNGYTPFHMEIYSVIPAEYKWIYDIVGFIIAFTCVYIVIYNPEYAVMYVLYKFITGSIVYNRPTILYSIICIIIGFMCAIHYMYLQEQTNIKATNDTTSVNNDIE